MDLRAAVKFLKLTFNNGNDGNKNQQQPEPESRRNKRSSAENCQVLGKDR